MYERKSDTPILIQKDYQTYYTTPCIADEKNDYDQQIYFGTGVLIEEHPLKGYIPFRGCGNCNSENVKVIYSQWSVSVHSGDVYWDYEIVCEDCKTFTARSFSENE